MFQISSGDPIKRRIPQGWKEYLLCIDCERHIGRFDDYAAKFFSSVDKWEFIETPAGRLYVVHKYDYKLLKLFLMSVLWRASVASIEPFQQVSLDAHHQEALRQMLLANDVGNDSQFRSVIFRYQSYKNLEKVTIAPHRIEEKGCITYFQLQFNEFPCRIKVSEQNDSDRYDGVWLSEKGPLRILEMTMAEKRLRAMVNVVTAQPKLYEEFKGSFKVKAEGSVDET